MRSSITLLLSSLLALTSPLAAKTIQVADNLFVMECNTTTKTATVVKLVNPNRSGAIAIPESVLVADGNKSYDCKVTAIGKQAFAAAIHMTSIQFPSTLKSIGEMAFFNCPQMARNGKLTLPESLETIGNAAFGCCKFASIEIPANVKSIGDNAFAGDSESTVSWLSTIKFNLPATALTIGREAFAYTELKVVNLPSRLTALGEFAFKQCKQLETVSFPGTLKTIPADCFQYSPNLKSTVIPEGVTFIGARAFQNTALESFNPPSTLHTIYERAFDNTKLKSVKFPSGIKKIDNSAFAHCKELTSFILPASINEIGEWMLYESDNLTYLQCDRITPPATGEYCFTPAQYKNAKCVVPAGSESIYKNNPEWKPFFDKASVGEIFDDSSVVPITYYDLNGVKVSGTLAPGIYIVSQGNRASKVIVK